MSLDKLDINGVQYTPAQYAIKVGFGITYNELVDWTKFHKDCNDFGELNLCKWIEDFFTEINSFYPVYFIMSIFRNKSIYVL